MSEVMLDIKQWGNNLGVRLPAAIAREGKLKNEPAKTIGARLKSHRR